MPGLASITAPPAPGTVAAPRVAGSDARLRETARNFEAQMLSQMLAPIFATTDHSRGRFGGGAGESQWRPMLVDAYAQAASRRGGFGIADAVYRQMLRMQATQGSAPAGAATAGPATGAAAGTVTATPAGTAPNAPAGTTTTTPAGTATSTTAAAPPITATPGTPTPRFRAPSATPASAPRGTASRTSTR